MIQVSREVLVSAAKVNFDCPEFVAHLKARLDKYHLDTMMQRDETSLRWAQGRAQEVHDLLELLENANALL